MLGSPRFAVTLPEIWGVLKVALLFGLVAGITKAIEGADLLDWGQFKFAYDAIVAGLLWLAKTYLTNTQAAQPHKYAGRTP